MQIDRGILTEVFMDERGAEFNRWWTYHHQWEEAEGEIIEELPISIYVNGIEFATMMGTPLNQDWLALGFLANEGIISDLDEIEILLVTPEGCCIDIWLDKPASLPGRKIITSGCGGGITFSDPGTGVDPFESDLEVTPDQLQEGFNNLQTRNSLYARSRGVHAAGLLNPSTNQLELIVEDVGRHNTIDKIRGASMIQKIPTSGKVLLCTGRISSEMLHKSAMMGIPILASRTSPTSLSVDIARGWNMTLVGYVRYGRLRVYSAPERLGVIPEEPIE
jgi:FdhD protein